MDMSGIATAAAAVTLAAAVISPRKESILMETVVSLNRGGTVLSSFCVRSLLRHPRQRVSRLSDLAKVLSHGHGRLSLSYGSYVFIHSGDE